MQINQNKVVPLCRKIIIIEYDRFQGFSTATPFTP